MQAVKESLHFLLVLLFSWFLFCCYLMNSVLLMTWASMNLIRLGFWCSSHAASMTLILGFFASTDIQLGLNCSHLIKTTPSFVQTLRWFAWFYFYIFSSDPSSSHIVFFFCCSCQVCPKNNLVYKQAEELEDTQPGSILYGFYTPPPLAVENWNSQLLIRRQDFLYIPYNISKYFIFLFFYCLSQITEFLCYLSWFMTKIAFLSCNRTGFTF